MFFTVFHRFQTCFLYDLFYIGFPIKLNYDLLHENRILIKKYFSPFSYQFTATFFLSDNFNSTSSRIQNFFLLLTTFPVFLRHVSWTIHPIFTIILTFFHFFSLFFAFFGKNNFFAFFFFTFLINFHFL